MLPKDGQGAGLAGGVEVVEWHDLGDPLVLLAIDVVAHAASRQELSYNEDGRPVAFMGIPLTRSLICPSCGTAIGWRMDTFSCPGCGGRHMGAFEANRGLPRMRISRQQWDDKHQATRRQLNMAPGRRDDVEGLTKDDSVWQFYGSDASESDTDNGRRRIIRGTIQASRPTSLLQMQAPHPAVTGSCLHVVALDDLRKVCLLFKD